MYPPRGGAGTRPTAVHVRHDGRGAQGVYPGRVHPGTSDLRLTSSVLGYLDLGPQTDVLGPRSSYLGPRTDRPRSSYLGHRLTHARSQVTSK